MVEYIITGEPQRIERFDYPLDAIREIVINMVVHRDYRDSSASIIKIFDDKIEFFNPGNLYGGITVNDLLSGNYSSKTRNKLIAKAFKEIGLIERYGSGISRIRKICREYGIKEPRLEEILNGFKVTLFKEKIVANDNVVDNVVDNVIDNVVDNVIDNVVDDRPESIMKLIAGNNQISAARIAKILKVTNRTIQRDIEKLKLGHKLRRVGGEKKGHWEINNNPAQDK